MELLPGRLAWAPDGVSPLDAIAGGSKRSAWLHVSALDFCGDLGKEYQVQHYSPNSYGRAFGPLSLAQTIAFCRNLHKAVTGPSPQAIELCTMRGNENAHTNATVLVGAYLILCFKWTAQRVKRAFGAAEAQRTFPCSWARMDERRFMCVADCWAGLELALREEWLTSDLVFDEVKYSIWASNLKHMAAVYDAAWLAPGSMMVSADPTTTAFDPNPATFREMFPSATSERVLDNDTIEVDVDDALSAQACARQVSGVDDACSIEFARQVSGSDDVLSTDTVDKDYVHCGRPCQEDIDDGVCSTDTVAKDYALEINCNMSHERKLPATDKPMDFVSFLKALNVSLVIRLNFANEPGMIQEYNASTMASYGIQHKDLPVSDHRGGLPDGSSVAQSLEALAGRRSEATLVHCKGGFGRSVVIACCILIHRLDIPGAALLGWVRLCRPGAITTAKQEQFLHSLRGRDDLRRYARREGSLPAPSCGCSVQ